MDWNVGKKEESENAKDSSSAMHDDDTANRVEKYHQPLIDGHQACEK